MQFVQATPVLLIAPEIQYEKCEIVNVVTLGGWRNFEMFKMF